MCPEMHSIGWTAVRVTKRPIALWIIIEIKVMKCPLGDTPPVHTRSKPNPKLKNNSKTNAAVYSSLFFLYTRLLLQWKVVCDVKIRNIPMPLSVSVKTKNQFCLRDSLATFQSYFRAKGYNKFLKSREMYSTLDAPLRLKRLKLAARNYLSALM